MAFTKQPTKAPTSVRNVVVVLKDWPAHSNPDVTAGQSAHFQVEVVYSDNSTEHVTGNLVPHLTAGQLTALQDFLAAMRAKAVAELL